MRHFILCFVLAVSVLGVATPAMAQDIGMCQQALLIYRQAVGAVIQKASDIPAALQARADLADEEAVARTKCSGLPQYYGTIDVTREDIDLSLGQAVPACKTAMDAAAPHVRSAFEIGRSGARDEAAGTKTLVFLRKARADAEGPCKDYQGVLGRILRAELLMESIGGSAQN